MKSIKTCLILVSALFFSASFVAQESENPSPVINPIQISFITPLGTNGIASWNTVNHLSINLIAGYNGGLEGIEIGGYINALKGDMTGIQIAGFGNTNFGKAKGVELAGFYNFNLKETEAVQLAGFANASMGTLKGVQLAGFSNYIHDESQAIQLAGFLNANLKSSKGLQLAGFANINGADSKAVQGAGFANITAGDLQGIQISGFLNVARRINGSQLGVFNYADSIENGVPIGFLSYVKHGYHMFEIGIGETLNGVASFKTGTKRFYNIFSVGAGLRDNTLLYGWGYGIGTIVPVTQKLDLDLDLVSYQINEDVWFSQYTNLLNIFHITASYAINEHFKVYGGPSMNVVISDIRNNGGSAILPEISWNIYDKTHHNTRVVMYPGLTAGIRF